MSKIVAETFFSHVVLSRTVADDISYSQTTLLSIHDYKKNKIIHRLICIGFIMI